MAKKKKVSKISVPEKDLARLYWAAANWHYHSEFTLKKLHPKLYRCLMRVEKSFAKAGLHLIDRAGK